MSEGLGNLVVGERFKGDRGQRRCLSSSRCTSAFLDASMVASYLACRVDAPLRHLVKKCQEAVFRNSEMGARCESSQVKLPSFVGIGAFLFVKRHCQDV